MLNIYVIPLLLKSINRSQNNQIHVDKIKNNDKWRYGV